MSKELKNKEITLLAELANRVMTATNKGRLDWKPEGDGLLSVKLEGGRAVLSPFLDDEDKVCLSVFNEASEEIGCVEDTHPALRFDLKNCYAKLLLRYDPDTAGHAKRVSTISKMFGALDAIVGDDVIPETQTAAPEAAEEEAALPSAHAEDEVEELDPEDESFVFQQDMAEQAAEFSTEAREQAGLPEEEEPLAQLPGRPHAPAPQPPPPAPAAPALSRKKMVRMVKKAVKRPVGPPPTKSRVLDSGQQ
jgi:hypothetical protein